ncbi:MAG: hypothetical protein ACOVSW_09460 [Candidatus Kapaibacteriota bacterium]
MKTGVAKHTSKIIAVLNRFDVPQVLSCRANAVNLATGEQASFWGNTSLPPVQENSVVHSSLSILNKKGRIFWLWDERLPNAGNLQSALQRPLQASLPKESGGDAPPPSRIDTLRVLADEVREWLQRQTWTEEERDFVHGAVLFLQPEGASILTFGKARVQVSTNRVRLRNLFSTGTFKDFLQDRIKSRVQERITTEISHEDWSWAINNEPFTCRLEHVDVQGAARFVVLASDIWLPTETEIVCGVALEHHGGTASAALAMRTAFGRIGERPRGACAVVDVLPQGVDTPDADDMMNTANKAAQAFKAVKGSSVLGFGLGKLGAIAALVGVLGYGAWQWWTAGRAEPTPPPPQKAEAMHRTHSDSSRRAARLLADSTDLDETDAGDETDTLQSTNTAIEKTIIAFENVPRTVVPILLKTSQPIDASNLASRVKVEIRGAQNITKYRIELDTAKRQLPPQTTRLNVIIEQPLSAGKYSVKLTYSEREVTSATVEIGILPQNTTLPDLNLLFDRTFLYGKQITYTNKQMAIIYKRLESALVGVIRGSKIGDETWEGNLENLTSDMVLEYRFCYHSGDTSAPHRLVFDKNVLHKQYLGGVQRGLYISSNVATIKFALLWQYPNKQQRVINQSLAIVKQAQPVVFAEESLMKTTWAYRSPANQMKGRKYYPNDIEISLNDGVQIEYEVPIDIEENGNNPRIASLEHVKISPKPSIRPIDFSTEDGFTPNTYWSSVVRIFNADNEEVFFGNKREEIGRLQTIPISAELRNGKYRCKFLVANLPPKPRNEVWRLQAVFIINTNAAILNPFNSISSGIDRIETEFRLPITLEYK